MLDSPSFQCQNLQLTRLVDDPLKNLVETTMRNVENGQSSLMVSRAAVATLSIPTILLRLGGNAHAFTSGCHGRLIAAVPGHFVASANCIFHSINVVNAMMCIYYYKKYKR